LWNTVVEKDLAIFESLLSEGGQAGASGRFMENWVDTRPKKKPSPPPELRK
jgi:hypothetical protein